MEQRGSGGKVLDITAAVVGFWMLRRPASHCEHPQYLSSPVDSFSILLKPLAAFSDSQRIMIKIYLSVIL